MFWQLILANPGPIVIEKLHASKLTDLIGEDKIFLTVADAVSTFGPKGEGEVWWKKITASTQPLKSKMHEQSVT